MRPSGFLLLLVLGACGRLGFDSSGDGGAASCTPGTAAVGTGPTDVTLCPGTNTLVIDAVAGATLTARLTLPTPQLAAATMSLVAPDAITFASPTWTSTGIEALGVVTTQGTQQIVIFSDAVIRTSITVSVSPPLGRVLYISPTGSDAANGSQSAPYFSWDFALSRLTAGDTLIAEDGEWPTSFDFDCTFGSLNGTAAQPITVIARHSRRAHISGLSTIDTARFNNCSYWIVDGLHLSNFDAGSLVGGAPLVLSSCTHMIARNLLVEHPNGCGNNNGIEVNGASTYITIEDSELYSFARSGILMAGGAGMVARRNYAHSRGWASCGGPDTYQNLGDAAFYCYDDAECAFDNLLAEKVASGLISVDPVTFHANGSLAHDAYYGVFQSSNQMPPLLGIGREVTDFACIDCDVGIWSRGVNVNVHNATLVEGTPRSDSSYGTGVAADGVGLPSSGNTTFRNVLSLDNTNQAFAISDQTSLLIDHSNAIGSPLLYPNAEDISDAAGEIQHSLSVAPTDMGNHDGDCIAYVPATSNMRGAGENGADIGANVIYQSIDGVLTDRKLWNQRTGAFPCGAIVPGVNDVPGQSCFDAHTRFRIGVAGCAIP